MWRREHGRAQAGQHHEAVVARLRDRVVDRRRQVGRERPVGHAGGVERLEHVGVAISQQVAEPGQHGVRMADLRGAPAVPFEGFVGVMGERGAISLEHGHVVALTGQGQGSAQSAHSGPDHDDAHDRIV